MDYFLFQKINSLAGQWNWLDFLAIFFAKYFEYFLVGLVFLLFFKKRKIIFQVFLAAILSRLVITDIIRWIFPRVRPFVENQANLLISQNPQESSFPSGHAAFYFAIAAVVYFYNKKAGLLFFIAAFLIGLARVFVGVHWPFDILAGALVGIFSGWLIARLRVGEERVEPRKILTSFGSRG